MTRPAEGVRRSSNLRAAGSYHARDAFSAYLAAAFAGELARDCPPLDHCWSGASDLAFGTLGETTVFAAGPGAETIAAALLVQG